MVTLTVRDVITYASTIITNQKLDVNNLQPGLGMANTVLGRMFGPPFVYRFNRSTFTQPITKADGTDYDIEVDDLGQIEVQWLEETGATVRIHELNGAIALAKTSQIARPTEVAPQFDDNEGNITLRFNKVPDQDYTAFFDYQRKAALIQSYAQSFGPMPDEFAYLYLKGFLAEAALLVNDSRFPIWNREFVGGLLYTQDGLDAQAKSIFLEQMLNYGRTSLRSQATGQAAAQARAQM